MNYVFIVEIFLIYQQNLKFKFHIYWIQFKET